MPTRESLELENRTSKCRLVLVVCLFAAMVLGTRCRGDVFNAGNPGSTEYYETHILQCLANLNACFPPPIQGLIGYWPLDGTAADASANGNNGTIMGTLNAGPDRAGTANGALQFDQNSANHINIPHVNAFASASFSMAMWFYWDKLPDGDGTLAHFLASKGNGRMEVHLGDFGGNVVVQGIRFIPACEGVPCLTNSAGFADYAGPLSAGWNHLVVTFDGGSRARIYVNSNLVVEKADILTDTDLTANTMDFLLGARNPATLPLLGRLDEVYFYNRELSSAEMARIAW